ncbi:RNA helicase aquarius [Caerostris extrusa]|uniref:RNA helicase aquarius n=1 Tax=Caerostris extrusa TaxID=172846 RepID=A0AAV4S9M3_CAEEX|nr:RNA helicase aquarius [Caerostris extrusa]
MASTVQKKETVPTVAQINADSITQLANKYWAPNRPDKLTSDPATISTDVINDIYANEIVVSWFSIRRVMVLELSQYLENCLWPKYNENASHSHMMSIVIMVNEKFLERVPAWESFKSKPENFPIFFNQVLRSLLNANVPLREKTSLLVFLIHCFNSCEVEIIRENVQKLVSLTIWVNILPERREQEFKKFPVLVKFWNKLKKKEKDLKLDELESF